MVCVTSSRSVEFNNAEGSGGEMGGEGGTLVTFCR